MIGCALLLAALVGAQSEQPNATNTNTTVPSSGWFPYTAILQGNDPAAEYPRQKPVGFRNAQCMESGWDPASNSSVMRVNMTQTMHCCSPNQGQMTSVHAVAQDGTEHCAVEAGRPDRSIDAVKFAVCCGASAEMCCAQEADQSQTKCVDQEQSYGTAYYDGNFYRCRDYYGFRGLLGAFFFATKDNGSAHALAHDRLRGWDLQTLPDDATLKVTATNGSGVPPGLSQGNQSNSHQQAAAFWAAEQNYSSAWYAAAANNGALPDPPPGMGGAS